MNRTYTPELKPDVLGRLADYAAGFRDDFNRPRQAAWCGVYLRGLVTDGDRKSVEPMAARVPLPEGLDVCDPDQALRFLPSGIVKFEASKLLYKIKSEVPFYNRLERQNLILKRLLMGVLVSALAAVLAAARTADTPKVLEAERLILRDSAGRERFILASSPNGSAGLVIFDQKRKPRFSVLVTEAGRPLLSLKNDLGQDRVTLGLLKDNETPYVRMNDGNGNIRAELSLDRNSDPGLYLYDNKSKRRAYLNITSKGSAGLVICDNSENPRISIFNHEDNPYINLSDVNGILRMTCSLSDAGSPNIGLLDQEGKLRLTASLGRSGSPHFSLLDKDNHELFVAPAGK